MTSIEFLYPNKVSFIDITLNLSILFNFFSLCLNCLRSLPIYFYCLPLASFLWWRWPYDVIHIDGHCSFRSNNPILSSFSTFLVQKSIFFRCCCGLPPINNYHVCLKKNVWISIDISLCPTQSYCTMQVR